VQVQKGRFVKEAGCINADYQMFRVALNDGDLAFCLHFSHCLQGSYQKMREDDKKSFVII